ncbi:hypothetical protein Nepgr_033457 [Nepenthes gracilis]|uniref:RRM domain-containing protein n=1 Tax=Nepenthes gracilis TaxID=150966 RepID=A0AAD3TMD8_NEPGR|nr:hypothetical protein Nepgr_033457 [Nepenthes gracilis]
MASSQQHRCVFVGNIPYDATEEQLIQICEEVGPVVSFRLVIDRETGKPKGYGFCEYKDEETALSARRNLQGYEINGRQLRVDFAENDKGADRNREQGRGGPGMATNIDPPKKQLEGLPNLGDPTVQQPIGLPLAMSAASIMAGALGGAQSGGQLNQNGLLNQSILGHDPLTLHLAEMSRSQLNKVMSEMKLLATQNKELARQLLLLSPQLPKALFQAQIMLGMVTPQMLQMANIRRAPGPVSQSSSQGVQPSQNSTVPSLPGLPPLAPLPSVPQNSSVYNQITASSQLPVQLKAHLPNLSSLGAAQQTSTSRQFGASMLPSTHLQPLDRTPAGSNMLVPPSSVRPAQAPLSQHLGQIGHGIPGHNSKLAVTNANLPPSLLTSPASSDPRFHTGSSVYPGGLDTNKGIAMPTQVAGDGTWTGRVNANANLPSRSSDRNNASEQVVRPSNLIKLDDRRGVPLSTTKATTSIMTEFGPSDAVGSGSAVANQSTRVEEIQNLGKQVPQLPPDVESALLQQVMNLTPQQLSSLPPEQQQQVLQLQKMLR